MNIGKTTAAVTGAALAFGAFMATPAVAATEPAEPQAMIYSRAPVPGAVTIGAWHIWNKSGHTLPVGTTFRVTFKDLKGGASKSTHTVTPLNTNTATVRPDPWNKNQYVIITKQAMRPGSAIAGLWSNTHWFRWYDRDQVTIKFDSSSVQTIPKSGFDAREVYNNNGTGF